MVTLAMLFLVACGGANPTFRKIQEDLVRSMTTPAASLRLGNDFLRGPRSLEMSHLPDTEGITGGWFKIMVTEPWSPLVGAKNRPTLL